MPAKIRLQRHGKKGNPFYHIVIADSRSPRDGKFIEKIGTYNPVADPAEIHVNFDKAVQWLLKGAQPTDTVRSILSSQGVMLRLHLLRGIAKGALTEVQAEAKFQTWKKEKEEKQMSVLKNLSEKERNDRKAKQEAEAKANEIKAAEVAKKRAAELKIEATEEKVEETPVETEEVVVDETHTEEVTSEEA
jgi:small subunit ribosomal protein S16